MQGHIGHLRSPSHCYQTRTSAFSEVGSLNPDYGEPGRRSVMELGRNEWFRTLACLRCFSTSSERAFSFEEPTVVCLPTPDEDDDVRDRSLVRTENTHVLPLLPHFLPLFVS